MIRGHWFGIVVAIAVSLSMGFQIYQVYGFMHQGKRFTAKDGQKLCERVAVLEKQSIGFQQSVIMPVPCLYDEGH